MMLKAKRKRFQIVLGIWRGLVEDVFLYEDEALAERKYERLRKKYGIKPGEESESENEVKWFEVPVTKRKVRKK